MADDHSIAPAQRPTLTGWIESFLPFSLPKLPFRRTTANIDKSLAHHVWSGAEHVTARIEASTGRIRAHGAATVKLIKVGARTVEQRVRTDPDLADRAFEFAVGDE